LAIVIHRKLY